MMVVCYSYDEDAESLSLPVLRQIKLFIVFFNSLG